MAYIPNNPISPSSDNSHKKKFDMGLLSVVLSDDDRVSEKDVCADISNICLTGEGIFVRHAQQILSFDGSLEGEIHSVTKEPFCEKLVIHSGACLYSVGFSEGKIVKIAENLPDKKSIICKFLSKLYIYSDTHVFSLDSSFVLKEEIPDAPMIFDNLSTVNPNPEKRLDVPLNMIAPIIKVGYNQTSLTSFKFPYLCDISRPIKVFRNDEEVDMSFVELTETNGKISGLGDEAAKISVIYYVKNPEEMGFKYDLYDCTVSAAFGGNANGGTRMFFTGNPNQKGRYYKTPLLNPLYFGEDEYEIIGDGCEDVTCLKKMYGNLIVFTENSVHRMGYSFTDDGAIFSVKELSSSIGCDCPGSVQLIDNRIVFANSEKGIFIIDSTGEADEQNIKPVAGNILKGRGKGFLDMDAQLLKKSVSADFDRKYMLFANGRVFIWDYDKTSFSDYGNYSKSQNRLGWYIYDDVKGDEVFNFGTNLLTFDTQNRCFYDFFGGSDGNITSLFRTGRMSLSDVTRAKFVTELELVGSSSKGAEISVSLFGDNEKYFESVLLMPEGKRSHFVLKLPRKLLYDVGVLLEGKGRFDIEGMSVKFGILK